MGSDCASWFARLSTKPLPGGVAAAAVAAAMGSALVVKVARLTLAQDSLSDQDRGSIGRTLDLAERQGARMMGMVKEDEQAYQAVLDTRRLSESAPERWQAWQQATEVPLQLAEGCQDLLERVTTLFGVCLPAATADLKAGCWLLEVGLRTGLEAAESNLSRWRERPESVSFLSRAKSLRDGRIERPWYDG